METVQTIRDTHHARWDIRAYQEGWNETDRILVEDYGTIDYPTAMYYAKTHLDNANAHGSHSLHFYRELGMAARWFAAFA